MRKKHIENKKNALNHNLKYFFLVNIEVFFVGFMWYSILRRNIGNWNLLQSSLVLILFHLIVSLITSFAEWTKRKDFYDALFNTVVSLGIYTIITYYIFKGKQMIIVLCLASIILIARITYLLTRYSRTHDRRVTKRVTVTDSKTIISLAFVAIIVLCGYTRLFGPALMYSSAETTVNTYEGFEEALGANISTISKLKKEEWDQLDINERLDVLQCVCDLDSIFLGVTNCSLKVGVGDPGPNTYGNYDAQRQLIIVSSNHILSSDSWEVCNTICHETCHCYQHCLAELYVNTDEKYQGLCIFNNVSKYTQEINNYIDSKDDFQGYYTQALESNAREHAIYMTYIIKKTALTGVPESIL